MDITRKKDKPDMPDLQALPFRPLDKGGLKVLVQWAKAEGWNPGMNDADIYWLTDPAAFYGFHHQGELIAGGSIVSYGGDFGFMGFFIVRPEFRSMGVGRHLWFQRRDTLLSRLKKGASIGMDGVVAMQPFYQKGGFTTAFRDERHQREGERFDFSRHISPIQDGDTDSILRYDRPCFGFARPQFLVPWLSMPESHGFKYVDGKTLKGYAVIRKATVGYRIGPLFADDPYIAEELYKACLDVVPGEPTFLDIPLANPGAVDLVRKYKTTYVFECARMYLGPEPAMAKDKIYGITTYELG